MTCNTISLVSRLIWKRFRWKFTAIFEDVCSLHTCFSADLFHLLCCITPCESSGRFFPGHPVYTNVNMDISMDIHIQACKFHVIVKCMLVGYGSAWNVSLARCANILLVVWRHKAHSKVTQVQRTLGKFYRPASVTRVPHSSGPRFACPRKVWITSAAEPLRHRDSGLPSA